MTEHESIQGKLPLYAAGALQPDDVRRVEQHAGACENCRAELLNWGLYAHGLTELPQLGPPLGLMERTRERMIEQHDASVAQRHENAMLAAMVVFGWAASFMTWILIRMLTGGTLEVLGVNLADGLTWCLVSTVFVWMTAASAAAMLGKRNELRRLYEPVS